MAARKEAARQGLTNARFETCDLATPKAVEAYDAITAFDVVHDLAQPKEVLAAIVRALRRDGTFFMRARTKAGVVSGLVQATLRTLVCCSVRISRICCRASAS